ncbi:hypothetical protein ABT063_42630 [Streptomyces sp. NPDC002838]|uniref:hypothetical protein n=1 Tax=Streptomyces sp. NPDC002838 TaxID=3154436 RepID=UPI0033318EF6
MSTRTTAMWARPTRDRPRPGATGHAVRSATDLTAWRSGRETAELSEPFTFVITMDGLLRLAPRRSEHVACGGCSVVREGDLVCVFCGGELPVAWNVAP